MASSTISTILRTSVVDRDRMLAARGHGDIGLASAIAYSCNSYFGMLTATLAAPDVAPIAARFGIEPPDRDARVPPSRESVAAGESLHFGWRAPTSNLFVAASSPVFVKFSREWHSRRSTEPVPQSTALFHSLMRS